jgi:hypothetical protein
VFFNKVCILPESLENKLHTFSRAFLHILQGVQNNTPFRLLHSLQIHTVQGAQEITQICSAWSQITDLME